MRSEVMRISHELQAQKDKIKENTEKIKVNKTFPYLVSNVIEVLKTNSIKAFCKFCSLDHPLTVISCDLVYSCWM